MDNDELYRHLRRDHLYCHFCDADGLHQYYSSYDYLRDHFRQEHYLCEEGLCAEEKFTGVFRTDIDLKAHKATVHGKQLSKAAAKQARTLELEFTLAPRGENRMNRRGVPGPTTSRSSRDYNGRDYNVRDYQSGPTPSGSTSFASNNEPIFTTRQPDVQSTDEFPTLGGGAVPPVVPTLTQPKSRGNVTIRSTVRNQPLAVTDENFPALGPDSAGPSISKTVNFSVSSSSNASGPGGMSQCQKTSTSSNVSIQVNHEPNGTVTTRVSGPNIRIRPAQLSIDSDFPALGSSEPSTSTANSTQWKEVLQWTCSKSASTNVPKSKKVAPAPVIPSPPTIQSGEDFPSLSKSSKSKKQSVITMVPSVPSWRQSSQNNSNSQSSSINAQKPTTEQIKSKTKKKKAKQTSSSNSSSGNESNNSKSNVNTAVTKKNVELAHGVDLDSASNESSQGTHDTNNSTSNIDNASKNSNVPNSRETEHANKKDKKKNKNNVDASSDIATIINTESGSGGSGLSNGEKQRKRSELKIDSLNTTNNNIHRAEDFPVLGSVSGNRLPDFTNPPPGFASPTPPPPPGFSIKYNSIDRLQGSNGLTFTNSSGESYSILPDNSSKHSYVTPPDFQKRNSCLVTKLNDVLVEQDKIEEFRYVSGLFRGGTCDAQEYYTHCREVMGFSAFESVFPELLALLPDIAKQQELFKVHKREVGGKTRGLEMCATCGQVLRNGTDFRTHMSSHTLENHFPALGKCNTPPPRNTWVRK